ncbi:hypothetical protein [Selenomonas sp. AB3002]|uniref:hypothetical protein n=1 Tax=Selenomonas sp. AB3002 TaxID=1392502 RepID=UPI000497D299
MTWWKNGLLLAAGGVAGLALAAWLESECENSREGKDSQADGMELLVEKVRKEAEWAMEECTTDEEREKVYEEVASSIRDLQATLKQRGDEIIADLKEQALSGSEDDEEEDGEDAVRKFKSSMEDLTKALDETLASIKPAPSV